MAEGTEEEKRLCPAVIDRIYGVIYGQCIGDAIGLLTEFMDKGEAKKYYGKYKKLEYDQKVPDMHRERWKAGDWTDDSDQMILIMDSLIENSGQVIPTDIAKRLLNWKLHGFAELGDFAGMGIGRTTNAVLTNPRFTQDPHAASFEVWDASQRKIAPNGAVMRTSILGVHRFNEGLESVVNNATQVCLVTHADPRCKASCIAVCAAIHFILSFHYVGFPLVEPDDATKQMKELNIGLIIQWSRDAAIKDLPGEHVGEFDKHIFAKSLSSLELAEPGKIGYTLKSMGAAFWALKNHHRSIRTVIQELVMEGGDADSNTCVAGALLGAYHGYSNLPDSWRSCLCHREWLNDRINSFIKMSFG